jgi:hypothetical protein
MDMVKPDILNVERNGMQVQFRNPIMPIPPVLIKDAVQIAHYSQEMKIAIAK